MKLDKVFLKYIMEHPQFYNKVEPTFFDDPKIKFVYELVRTVFFQNQSHGSPNNHQIVQLVRKYDPQQDLISDQVLKLILETDLSKYQRDDDDDWLHGEFKNWIIKKSLRHRITQSIRELRDLDDKHSTLNQTIETAERIRELVGDISVLGKEEDIGHDFFNSETHTHDISVEKIPSGWENIDNLLDGGWDRSTLNIFIAPSNAGKSLWMGNCLTNAVRKGFNCLYVTLEMSHKQVYKRIAMDLLNITSERYDEVSRNPDNMRELIISAQQNQGYGILENNGFGKLWVKEYQTGEGTVAELDNYLKETKDRFGIDFDLICVDYLTIMNAANKNGSLYDNGKKLAEGLRGLSQKWNCVMISAVQVSRDAFNANDIQMKDISESKAILETCDTMFAIIRTDSMRQQNIYVLKLLKFRNGEFKWIKCKFDFDPRHLRIENDVVLE